MDQITIDSPAGRPVTLRGDRWLILLNCRHWMQSKTPLPTGGRWECGSCRRPRDVVASLSGWTVA